MEDLGMSFLYPAAFPVPASHSSRRSATLPLTGPNRIPSPPATAPTIPNGSSPRNRPPERAAKLVNTLPEMSTDVGSMMREMDRLSAACEEHERKIRSSRTSIEHRLFSELPHIMSKLNEADDFAEGITAQLQSTLQSLEPSLQAKLSEMIHEREADVETMRGRTTPWTTLMDEAEEKEGPGHARIERVEGVRADDGLVRIERWAEEVETYLNGEIVRLRQKLADSRRRKKWLLLTILIAVIISVACGLIAL